jgi:hypothetical protein
MKAIVVSTWWMLVSSKYPLVSEIILSNRGTHVIETSGKENTVFHEDIRKINYITGFYYRAGIAPSV